MKRQLRRPGSLRDRGWQWAGSRASAQSQSEAGLTLIECLVAIIVVVMIGASIAPVMVLAVATRINSQRSEQALELAQSEIDRVRVLIERGEIDPANLPPTTDNDVQAVGPPTTEGTKGSLPKTVTEAIPVDIDDDSEFDFAVQVYRTEGVDGNPVAFDMGVRVYDYRAFDGGTPTSTDPASLSLKRNEDDRQEAPLAVLYTSISFSETGQSLCNLVKFTSSKANPGMPLGCN